MRHGTPTRLAEARSKAPGLIVEYYTELDQLYPLVPEWERLVGRAADPNIFYEPWMMLPALELFPRRRLETLAVYAGCDKGRQLVGLFPFERSGRFGRLGATTLRSLRYYYCSLCTPLVDVGCGFETVAAAVATLRLHCADAEFGLIGADGRVLGWLEQAASAEPGFRCGERIERALLRRFESPQAYVSATFVREAKKKDMARLERRLAALGDLRLQVLDQDGPLESWLDEFLELEARGWKGRERSALATVPGGGEFFRRICREAHCRARLELHALRLDGVAVAMMCMMRVADGMVFLRTAYDETYSRFSPGLLLAFKFTCGLHERPGIEWLDSCSDPNAVMANRVWKHRRPLAGLRIHYGSPLLGFLESALGDSPA